jgi:hypothetical protein
MEISCPLTFLLQNVLSRLLKQNYKMQIGTVKYDFFKSDNIKKEI